MAIYLDENGNEIRTGAVQVSRSGKRGHVDTVTTPAVPIYLDEQGNEIPAAGIDSVQQETPQDRTARAVAELMKNGGIEAVADNSAANVKDSENPSTQMLLPRFMAQIEQSPDVWPTVWAGVKDAASLPGRSASGLVSGLSTFASTGSPSEAGAALMQDMAAPTGVQGVDNPVSNFVGSVLKDPLTAATAGLGGIKAAGVKQFTSAFLPRAGIATGLFAGRDIADQAANPYAPEITPGSVAKDVAKNGAMVLGGEGLGLAGKKVFGGLGGFFRDNFDAPDVMQRFMKPTGSNIPGIRQFAEDGLSPEVWNGSGTKQQVGENFLKLYPEKVGEPISAWKTAADQVAATDPSAVYPASRVINAMEDGFEAAKKYGRGAFSPENKAAAMDLVLSRVAGEGDALLPSATHDLKSQFLNEGFGHEADRGLAKAKEIAFKAAGMDMKGYLAQKFQDYAPLMEKVAPWVAAKPGMEAAAIKGGNNNLFSLQDAAAAAIGEQAANGSGAAGILAGLGSKMLNSPRMVELGPWIGRFLSKEAIIPAFARPGVPLFFNGLGSYPTNKSELW